MSWMERLSNWLRPTASNFAQARAPDGRLLMPHQIRLANRLVSERFLIGAHDVGLGKSLAAAMAAAHVAQETGVNIVVVSPATAKGTWMREFEELKHPFDWYSVDRIPDRLEQASVVILDEAQSVRNLTAQRTRRWLRFIQSPLAVYRWLLTATPMHNGDPANLFPLLASVGHDLGRDWPDFDRAYNVDRMTDLDYRRMWDRIESKFDVAVHADVPKMPRKRRVERKAELNEWGRNIYGDMMLAARAEYKARGLDKGAQALALFGRMREAASIAKTPLIADWMDERDKSVTFSLSLKSLEALHRQWGGYLLTGDTPTGQRRLMQDGFNKGERDRFFLSLLAGGVSLSLIATDEALLADRALSLGDTLQAEGRIVRLSQPHPNPTVYWLSATDIDYRVDELNASKSRRVVAVFGGLPIVREWSQASAASAILRQLFGG